LELEHRNAGFGRGLLDRLAEGRAGEEDAVGAVVLGVLRQQQEPPDHGVGEPPLALAVARQRGVEDVDAFRLGP
jgi:hypothetical protein